MQVGIRDGGKRKWRGKQTSGYDRQKAAKARKREQPDDGAV